MLGADIRVCSGFVGRPTSYNNAFTLRASASGGWGIWRKARPSATPLRWVTSTANEERLCGSQLMGVVNADRYMKDWAFVRDIVSRFSQ